MEPEDWEALDPTLAKLDRFLDGEEQTTLYFELEKLGQAPPMAEGLDDDELKIALTNLVWGLLDLGVVIECADHLSDRELYVALLDYCDEPNCVFPEDPYMTCHWSPVSDNWEDGVYLRYYADEKLREQVGQDYPEIMMPPSELPPYPRPWIRSRRPIPDDMPEPDWPPEE